MSNNLLQQSKPEGESAWDAVFSDLPDLNEFEEFKKLEIAADLSALMVHAGVTRSQLARLLGWTRSRVTKVLSGDTNPTLKTVYEFSRALGYDVNLTYRRPVDDPVPQPWMVELHAEKLVGTLQTSTEVRADFASGLNYDLYIRLGEPTQTVQCKDMGYVDEVKMVLEETGSFSPLSSTAFISMMKG